VPTDHGTVLKGSTAWAPGRAALTALFGNSVTASATLYKFIRAAQVEHAAKVSESHRGHIRFQSMAFIISDGDVADSQSLVDGMTPCQVLHLDVKRHSAVSLTSCLPGQTPAQYLHPPPSGLPSLEEALLQLGFAREHLPQAMKWCTLPWNMELDTRLPAMLPALIRYGRHMQPSNPDDVDRLFDQTLFEHEVVHRGMDVQAGKARIYLFMASMDGRFGSAYDGEVQHVRYQHLLQLWLFPEALYCLFKDRVDMPDPGATYGFGHELGDVLNEFVGAACADDAKNGRSGAVRRRLEPTDELLQRYAPKLAAAYLAWATHKAPITRDPTRQLIDRGIPAIQLGGLTIPPPWAAKWFLDNHDAK
jgi:hypothetical protein